MDAIFQNMFWKILFLNYETLIFTEAETCDMGSNDWTPRYKNKTSQWSVKIKSCDKPILNQVIIENVSNNNLGYSQLIYSFG